MVEQLTEKCQQLQVEQKDCRQQLEQLQTEHAGALGKMEALRSKFTLPSVQMSHVSLRFTFTLMKAKQQVQLLHIRALILICGTFILSNNSTVRFINNK